MKHAIRILLFIVISSNANLLFAQTINVVTEEWPPYSFTQNGEVVGISTEIVKAALIKSGMDYTINSYPWARAYDAALTNKNTLIFSLARTKHRESKFKWVSLLHPPDPIYLYRKRSNIKATAKTLQQAQNFIVATVRSSFIEQHLIESGFNLNSNLVTVTDTILALRMLQADRVDYYSGSSANFPDTLAKIGMSTSELEPTIFLMDIGLYAAFSLQTDDKTVEKLKRAFREVLKATDTSSNN